jgi:predicted CoA-substrate-specific enzyme activase
MTPSTQDPGAPDGALFVGIDAGSVSLNGIVIDERKRIVHATPYRRHFGRVEECLAALVGGLEARFGRERSLRFAFTGSHGRQLSAQVDAPYEFGIVSQLLGAVHIAPEVRTVICMGGQETALLQVAHRGPGWELEHFSTNGPCASGTGSFIDQQAERLATSIYERRGDRERPPIDQVLADFIALGLKSRRAASVACRCTVFTKSDMIHLQNKGERLEDIIHGLHVGNARNYVSTLVAHRVLHDPILFIGGLSLNPLQVQALRDYFPNLAVPPHSTAIGALGAALHGLATGSGASLSSTDVATPGRRRPGAAPVGLRLELRQTSFPETNELPPRRPDRRMQGFLGIDIGSTSTKYALVDESGQIVHKHYIPTQGRPVEAVQSLLEHLRAQAGPGLQILGAATTGSGRNVVGDFLKADLVIDEITAHARGAVAVDPAVDTIFEIGGQDSKYVSIRDTHPLDFDMNKVCAAGTGSFLHELANKLGIDIVGEFQEIALAAERPVKLAERCTVFMESDLMSYHQKGEARQDLIAGLCYAVVHNYLNRVVGKRRIGERVMFLGGPSLNKGVVAAFENVLGRGLLVPRHREVLGAFGAAVCVQEKMCVEGRGPSTFRGIERAVGDRMIFLEKTCQADPKCQNQCKLKIYSFDGRKSVWGGECGRHDISRGAAGRGEDFFQARAKIWEDHMQGRYATLPDAAPLMEVDGRPTVGLPRALYGVQGCLLWAHFFDYLGFRLVLSPPTNEDVSRAGIEAMTAESCYPVKVSHGHARMLLGRTQHLFLPTPVDMATPHARERGYYCPMVQSNAYMIRAALGISAEALLSPTLNLGADPDMLALDLHAQMGRRLGAGRRHVRRALRHALECQDRFEKELHARGRHLLERIGPDEPLVIVTGRPYNLYDERLNLRLGQRLARIGLTALPMDFIDLSRIPLREFASFYWGLGARILRAARLVAATPNYFGLHLTNFGCGADSFIEHFYKHLMGAKASLILELDEHSAAAGVMTRLEAYQNVIHNSLPRRAPAKAAPLAAAGRGA